MDKMLKDVEVVGWQHYNSYIKYKAAVDNIVKEEIEQTLLCKRTPPTQPFLQHRSYGNNPSRCWFSFLNDFSVFVHLSNLYCLDNHGMGCGGLKRIFVININCNNNTL